MKNILCTATLAATLPLGAAAAAPDPAASAWFGTEVRIEVGRDGQVTDVVPDRTLSPVLATAVRRHVSAWRFDAPMRDGRPVSGTTYSYLTGCAVPSAEGLSLAFDRATNGPGHGTQGIVGTHLMPARRLEGSFKVDVDYRVQPDGSVVVDGVRSDGRPSAAMRAFEKDIANWLSSRRFLPEKVDGEPVGTRMAYPLTYTITRVKRGTPLPRGAAPKPSCSTASEAAGASSRPVAVDSPFRLVPAG